MTTLPRCSGDILADRRADYAEMLFANGEHAAAAELMLSAMELAPGWVLGWFRLGEFHEAAGETCAAEKAWRTTLALDPADHAGAALRLALIGADAQPTAPPSAFVEGLFDEYADRFDASLTGALGYRAPELLERAIRRAAPGRQFPRALDLGCGTGLMGVRLRSLVGKLEGQDISSAMLRKAEARGVYDRLDKSDLQMLALDPASVDLVTAADVFIYLGALDRVFATVAGGLSAGGLFAFSVEALDADGGFRLRETRRYAHSEAYLRETLASVGLTPAALERDTIRKDRNEPVAGLIVIATR